jgi:hypothetical protein
MLSTLIEKLLLKLGFSYTSKRVNSPNTKIDNSRNNNTMTGDHNTQINGDVYNINQAQPKEKEDKSDLIETAHPQVFLRSPFLQIQNYPKIDLPSEYELMSKTF